ncbi:hypothetical protein F2Q70_00031369 [Brassica cretica]|uniref:Uncharacterized protein n=1 Tax=Brassica cretica TaxID=69181 RepID=A0A8S9FTM7_BRACR|nr:hypothetical protein F2Q70_00031369 [Brassica cretica]
MTSPVNHDPMEALMVAPMRKTPSLMTDGGSDSGRQEWLRERKATRSTKSCDGARDLKKPWCGDGRRSYRWWWRWNPARRRRLAET